jgi:hypothetical protein
MLRPCAFVATLDTLAGAVVFLGSPPNNKPIATQPNKLELAREYAKRNLKTLSSSKIMVGRQAAFEDCKATLLAPSTARTCKHIAKKAPCEVVELVQGARAIGYTSVVRIILHTAVEDMLEWQKHTAWVTDASVCVIIFEGIIKTSHLKGRGRTACTLIIGIAIAIAITRCVRVRVA